MIINISKHVVDRYKERINKEVGSEAIEKIIIEAIFKGETLRTEKRGIYQQEYIFHKGVLYIVKRDKNKIIVTTVLGPESEKYIKLVSKRSQAN